LRSPQRHTLKFIARNCDAGSTLGPVTLGYVFDPRRIFGPKRDEVMGASRKLQNEELHSLYSSPSIIRVTNSRRIRWVGLVARMGEKNNAYRILVVKPEGKRPLRRLRRRWLNNIKIGLREMGWGVMD
jgi:hypothetical protein